MLRKTAFMTLAVFLPFILGLSPMQKGGTISVEQGQTVEDIVSYGSTVIIKGEVYGAVYAVAADVLISAGAVIKGDVTLIRGSLSIEGAPVFHGEVTVYDTVIRTTLPYLVKGDTLEFKESGFRIRSVQEPVDPKVVEYMQKYLILARPVPSSWPPAFPDFVAKGPSVSGMSSFKIPALAEFEINRDIIDKSLTVGGVSGDRSVRITTIKFNTTADADTFWKKVRTLPETKINHSLHISLGGGAHWVFRHRDVSIAMWYQGNCFMCCEVGGDGPASAEARDEFRDKIMKYYEDKYNKK